MKLRMTAVVSVVSAGVLAMPGAASAKVPGQEGGLVALSEPGSVAIHPGETVPVTIAVGNNTNISGIPGVFLNVTVTGGLDLPHSFTNCWYYSNAGIKGAWCLFDGAMQAGGVYAAVPFAISAARHARADEVGGVAFQWGGWGGADTMLANAVRDAGPGSAPVRGSSGTLGLSLTTALPSKKGPPAGTAPVHVVGPLPPTAQLPSGPGKATTASARPSAGVQDAGVQDAGEPVAESTTTPAVPAGGRFTEVTAQPISTGWPSSAAAAGGRSDAELAATGSLRSAPALVGTGCFVVLAGMMLSYAFARRRRKFTA